MKCFGKRNSLRDQKQEKMRKRRASYGSSASSQRRLSIVFDFQERPRSVKSLSVKARSERSLLLFKKIKRRQLNEWCVNSLVRLFPRLFPCLSDTCLITISFRIKRIASLFQSVIPILGFICEFIPILGSHIAVERDPFPAGKTCKTFVAFAVYYISKER